MQPKGPQARRNALGLVRVLRPSETDVLVAADESDAFAKSIRRFEENFRYRFPDDGTLWTSGITLHPSPLQAADGRAPTIPPSYCMLNLARKD